MMALAETAREAWEGHGSHLQTPEDLLAGMLSSPEVRTKQDAECQRSNPFPGETTTVLTDTR